MIILGIDPGSVTTGFGIIQSHHNKVEYITSGCIRIGKYEWSVRLKNIFKCLEELIQEHKPDVAAIEKVFVHKNALSALKLGQARGAAITACACHDLPVAEYSPKLIKQVCAGYGGADKSQVQHMVKMLYNLKGLPQEDAADALAVAFTHNQHIRLEEVTSR